jgi:hypothetical protein
MMATVTQDRFAEALADTNRPMPNGLAAWNGSRPERRFAVYRNNVFWGLTESLKSRFPATTAIVGEEFFTAMAAEYIRIEPPRSPLLLDYGDTLADFVARFEPVAGLPYLPDVIRLEAARSHAYHAADASPLDAADLSGLDPDRLPSLVLTPHPSLSVLRSPHPVVTIWAMNSGEMAVGPIDDCPGEDALVVRPGMVVHVHRLAPGGAAFVQALGRSLPLGDAVNAALAADGRFDLAANLAGILQSGAFAAFA